MDVEGICGDARKLIINHRMLLQIYNAFEVLAMYTGLKLRFAALMTL